MIHLNIFNAGVSTHKAMGIEDLIVDHGLHSLAINEIWIRDDAPDSIKFRLAPNRSTISHVHRPVIPGGLSHGSRLAFIAIDNFSIRPQPLQTRKPSSFELQVKDVKVSYQVVAITNIY